MFVNKLFIHISLMRYPDNRPPRKITPLPPPVRVGVSVKVRVSFRVGDNQTFAPEKNDLWLGLGFGLGLVLGLGDNFPRGQLY